MKLPHYVPRQSQWLAGCLVTRLLVPESWKFLPLKWLSAFGCVLCEELACAIRISINENRTCPEPRVDQIIALRFSSFTVNNLLVYF